VKRKRGRKPNRVRRGPVLARLPLPQKKEARHADPTKYERAREKERLRHEIGSSERER
jgi:hypothetical protein